MKIKNTTLVIVILTSIVLLGLFVISKQDTQPKQYVKDCSRLDHLNKLKIDDNLTNKEINSYFNPGYEYTKTVPGKDKLFAIQNLYPLIKDENDMLAIYTQAIECEDIRIARLLTDFGVPGSGEKKYFDQYFTLSWNQLKAKKINFIRCSNNCFNGSTLYYFTLNSEKHFINVIPISEVQGFKVPKVQLGFIKCGDLEPKCE